MENNGQELNDYLMHYLRQQYHDNKFVNLLGMELVSASRGGIVLSMKIDGEKHTNLYRVVHGGAMASLADTAMGVCCATMGSRVVTLSFNMNFIRNIEAGSVVKAIGSIIHHGRRTMVAEAELVNEEGKLLCKASGTFFVIGEFETMEKEVSAQT